MGEGGLTAFARFFDEGPPHLVHWAAAAFSFSPAARLFFHASFPPPPNSLFMSQIDALRDTLPEAAKDLRLNLQAVLRPENLTSDQVWGIALASAYFIGHKPMRDAVLADATAAGLGEAFIEDAKASASIMGMNTVYYRFRHLVEKPAYATMPARLRMLRMGQPATDKTTFELMSMACAALAGCGMCIQAHEATLAQHGVSEAAIHDSVRIASVIQGAVVGLNIVAE